ncbi:prolactin regulatory element-binding protein [Ischnura elegans]|uniref:prolactin regulatory element-binding protein n=1 Tax=Ischnura elegans TaxID=197161 RepID=UPI001ED89CBB|nr:prolactin regulatory element-binding protein [Ischnura elegans]
MPSNRKTRELLARVNFPLYTLQMLTSRHILVAGGGGSSKTGVANGFEIFELSHDGKRFVVDEVVRHETGLNAVMNCATSVGCGKSLAGHKILLAAGQEGNCQLYSVSTELMSSDDEKDDPVDETITKEGVVRRRRHGSETYYGTNGRGPTLPNVGSKVEEVDGNRNTCRRITFDIQPKECIQTDFSKGEPLQRVVRLGRNCQLMATGGTDGHVRLWKFNKNKTSEPDDEAFPQPSLQFDLSAHSKEIDDLALSPDDKWLVSVSKDGHAIIWDTKTGKQFRKLTWDIPEGTKYLFKRCRFGVRPAGENGACRLFTISNRVGWQGARGLCKGGVGGYLHLWDPSPDGGPPLKSTTSGESLSALAVSDDGKFVSTGTMFSGSVDIFIAFSLQRVLHVEGAHSMFITGLEFVPTSGEGEPPITSDSEAAVLSISVDNQVCIHSVASRSTIPVSVAMFLIVIIMLCTFCLCSFLGL